MTFSTTACSKFKIVLIATMLSMSLNGCSGRQGPATAVFFPPAPNQPRIQYLMGISDSADIEGRRNNFSIFVFGEPKSDKIKAMKKPYGITASGGKIYVCDMGAASVLIIDPVAKTFASLKGNYSTGKLKKPSNVTVDKEGNIYVADVERKEVLIYDAEGNFRNAFGREHNMKPVDVAVDGAFIYVLDLLNNEIKVLSRKDGSLTGTIGKNSSEGGLSMSTNLTTDSAGFIYSTNAGSGKVLKLDRDGHIISSFGKMGDGFGQFGRPKGISVDQEGRIFVADAAHQNVQIFDSEGKLLMFFGDPGLPYGSMNLPADVVVTKDNLDYFQKLAAPDFVVEEVIMVTNQFGKAKVGIYGLGHKKNDSGKGSVGSDVKQAEKTSTAGSL